MINKKLDDNNNDGFIDDIEMKYYDTIIENNIYELNQKEYEKNMYTYIVYIMFNAVIYKSIVGEKKMNELYGKHSNNKEITIYNDINEID